MNRAEYEAISNRCAALEARCELLEAELKQLKSASLDAAITSEQERVTQKASKRAGSF